MYKEQCVGKKSNQEFNLDRVVKGGRHGVGHRPLLGSHIAYGLSIQNQVELVLNEAGDATAFASVYKKLPKEKGRREEVGENVTDVTAIIIYENQKDALTAFGEVYAYKKYFAK